MTGRDRPASFVAMTFNVGNGLAAGPRLGRYLARTTASIVGLQEVAPQQAEVLDSLTGRYPYRIVSGTGFSGRAVLSEFPIIEHDWIVSDPERPDLRVTIDIDGTPVTLVVAHPLPPRPHRAGLVFDPQTVQQIHDIAELAVEAPPAVILGDFNMTVRNPEYRWMAELGLRDAFRDGGSGPGRTIPLRIGRSQRVNRDLSWMPLRPVARVDYIWHTREFATREAWLGEDAGSDHLPVLARLELTG